MQVLNFFSMSLPFSLQLQPWQACILLCAMAAWPLGWATTCSVAGGWDWTSCACCWATCCCGWLMGNCGWAAYKTGGACGCTVMPDATAVAYPWPLLGFIMAEFTWPGVVVGGGAACSTLALLRCGKSLVLAILLALCRGVLSLALIFNASFSLRKAMHPLYDAGWPSPQLAQRTLLLPHLFSLFLWPLVPQRMQTGWLLQFLEMWPNFW